MSRLVLIDGNAILHRAYHALPRLTSKKGTPINAVYGFCSMLFKIINDLQPEYLAVAFDRPEPTFRHQEFIGYQAQRPKIEEELAIQIDQAKELLKTMGIKIFEKPGYEADDLIGTIAAIAAKDTKRKNKKKRTRNISISQYPNIEVIIVTGDKDLMQLVNQNTKLYLPVRSLSQGELVNEKGVQEKLGIKPGQVIDYKALVGDPSDNYPGVPGIGPKTAIKLLNQFGSLEKIYQTLEKHPEKLPPSLVKKLKNGRQSAFLSQKLAAIVRDLPFKIDWQKLKLTRLQNEKTFKALKKLGFKSLVKRLENSRGQTKPKKEKQLGLFG